MKPRSILTGGLLLFVAASVAAIIYRETQSITVAPPTGADKVIVYYFHGNVRCPTCRKIEALADQALRAGFADELQSGRLEWRRVNLDEAGNDHFVADYELETRSLVVADYQAGRQMRWKNLKQIWELAGDDTAFRRYVQDETRAYLESR
jgi:hypothetical protein